MDEEFTRLTALAAQIVVTFAEPSTDDDAVEALIDRIDPADMRQVILRLAGLAWVALTVNVGEEHALTKLTEYAWQLGGPQ